MSDFGTMVTVHRTDKSDASPADLDRVKRVAKDLVAGPGDRLSDYADFNLKFGGSSRRDGEGIMVGLTEYWGGDDEGNEGLSDDALVARDTPLAERFCEELQSLLGDEFDVKPYCGDW